jgi:uncharacterized membrane protein
MTTDQITGILRAILAAIGGFILAKGWISADNWNWIVGGVVTLAPVIWSWIANRPASIAASAQGIQGVDVVTSSSASSDVKAAVAAAK